MHNYLYVYLTGNRGTLIGDLGVYILRYGLLDFVASFQLDSMFKRYNTHPFTNHVFSVHIS